eukprot:TRINITY_DN2579_c0_g1_i2.p1 TRINITY_DN2579_c0_g1~~TRINITY_DN2579_c0_g1_i2.p1  ORF type:complete len:172 (+),score=24.32 TRINITY_DN2579_c0_g1_i2:132-647(+)
MERSATRRLVKELKGLQLGRDDEERSEVHLTLKNPDDLSRWVAHIKGPEDTPYAGGWFTLDIVVPDNYPLKPPSVSFVTNVFHPNVLYKTGEICLDLLKDAWTPAFTLVAVCRAIIGLLGHPEPDSPFNVDCGNLLRSGDTRGYWSLARMYTRLHARFNDPYEMDFGSGLG